MGLDRMSRIRLFRRWRELIAYVREGIRTFSAEMPSDYGTARALLGEDFISPEDIMDAYLELDYDPAQIRALHNALPSKDVLEWCREHKYIVIAAPPRPLSLIDIHKMDINLIRTGKGSWIEETDEDFYRNELVMGKWLIIRSEPAPHSLNKNEEQQEKIPGEGEYIPTVAEMAWVIAAFYRVRGHARLFEHHIVRTSSHDEGGDALFIGHFTKVGALLSAKGRRYHNPSLGLAIGRKV